MAKKANEQTNDSRRIQRRQQLLERKAQKENRQLTLIIGSIVGFLLLVVVAALIVEYVVRPGQPIATVGDVEISLSDWQERVVYERAQLVVQVNTLSDTFDGDIGRVQQFAQQQLFALNEPAQMGQQVLDAMIDELLIKQEAQRRGIRVSEDEIDRQIEESYGYYRGESPTPAPTAVETLMPTPSITPIPTAVITDVLPTETPAATATLGPTATPRPTQTPIPLDFYEAERDAFNERLVETGGNLAIFRQVIEAQLYREKLLEQLADEAELEIEGSHASFFIIVFESEEEALETLDEITARDFVTVWNEIRSAPVPTDPEATPSTAFATEVIERTREDLEANIDVDALDFIFDEANLNAPSGILLLPGAQGVPDQFALSLTHGFVAKEFASSRLTADRQAVLTDWLESVSITNVTQFEMWRSRVPQTPSLDPEFFAPQSTFTPAGAEFVPAGDN